MTGASSSLLRICRLLRRLGFTVGAGFAAVASAQVIWDAGAGTGNWVDANNWSTNTVPLATDAIQFAGSLQTTIATGANRTLSTLAFNAGASAFTINSNTLTINGGSVTNNSSNLQTVASAITQGAATTYSAASGNLAFTGAVNNGGFLVTS